MKFLYKQFPAKKKDIIEVGIDRPAKVKFMTALDFSKYKKCRTHKYFGGHFAAGRVRFVLPFDAVWYAVVEQGTHFAPDPVRADANLLPPDRNALSTVALDAPAHVKALKDPDGVAAAEPAAYEAEGGHAG